jgi:hypothetical protein
MYNPEAKEEIPEVRVENKKILLGSKWYDLILCYLCPICKEPVIAYWQVKDDSNRVAPQTVGRALRDSGFGGFRFFETKDGQGFEYDPVKDPRAKHKHSKEKSRGYGPVKYEILYAPFIELNPVFSVNHFFQRTLDPQESEFGKGHRFVMTQSAAMDFIEVMQDKSDTFKISKDLLKHGKPIFWFNVIPWEDEFEYYHGNLPEKRLALLKAMFGDAMISGLDLINPFKKEEPTGGRKY